MTRKTAAIIDGKYRETPIDLGPRTVRRHTPRPPTGINALSIAQDMHAVRERRRIETRRAANQRRTR